MGLFSGPPRNRSGWATRRFASACFCTRARAAETNRPLCPSNTGPARDRDGARARGRPERAHQDPAYPGPVSVCSARERRNMQSRDGKLEALKPVNMNVAAARAYRIHEEKSCPVEP